MYTIHCNLAINQRKFSDFWIERYTRTNRGIGSIFRWKSLCLEQILINTFFSTMSYKKNVFIITRRAS